MKRRGIQEPSRASDQQWDDHEPLSQHLQEGTERRRASLLRALKQRKDISRGRTRGTTRRGDANATHTHMRRTQQASGNQSQASHSRRRSCGGWTGRTRARRTGPQRTLCGSIQSLDAVIKVMFEWKIVMLHST